MKTLKKYLIFCLISVVAFLIPAISKADTFKNVEWKYTEEAAKFPNENVDLLNNLYDYINDRTFYTTYSSYKVDKNAVVWDFHHLNENYIVGVFILPTFENSSLIYASYVNRSSNKDYNMYNSDQSNKIYINSSTVTLKFIFNENKEITGYESVDLTYNNISVSSWSMFFSSNALYNNTYISYLDLYVDTHFIQADDSYGYVKIQSAFEDANLKLKIGSKTFSTDERVPIKTFFDSLKPNVVTWNYKDRLNGSNISYTIRDDEIVIDKSIRLEFIANGFNVGSNILKYSSNLNSNNAEIELNECSYSESQDKTYCYFYIKYTRINTEDITFNFKFDNYDVRTDYVDIYESSVSYDTENNLVYLTNQDIEYSYSKIDLWNADIKGIAFIPYDYSTIDINNSRFSNFSFSMYFSLANINQINKIYYSSGYLERKDNNKYIVSSDSVFNLFDLNSENNSIDYWYNYGTVTNKKLPAFIIMNEIDKEYIRNWPDRHIYLTYNSTIYKYVYIKEDENGNDYIDSSGVIVKDYDGNDTNISGSNNDTFKPNLDLSTLSNYAGWLPPGPVDSVLNLPFVMLNSLSRVLNGTCTPVDVTIPFINSKMSIPCVSNLYDQMGVTSFFDWIGIVVSALMIFSYLIFLYNWLDNILSLGRQKVINWGTQ